MDQPCADCDEVRCTVASIEPEGSDLKYEKYKADPNQAELLSCLWEDRINATTFETCAAEAASNSERNEH